MPDNNDDNIFEIPDSYEESIKPELELPPTEDEIIAEDADIDAQLQEDLKDSLTELDSNDDVVTPVTDEITSEDS
jgi:hypothetical protein